MQVAFRTMERPLCTCHGEPMRARGGGRPSPWRCAVKQRACDAKYEQTINRHLSTRRSRLRKKRERITNQLEALRNGAE